MPSQYSLIKTKKCFKLFDFDFFFWNYYFIDLFLILILGGFDGVGQHLLIISFWRFITFGRQQRCHRRFNGKSRRRWMCDRTFRRCLFDVVIFCRFVDDILCRRWWRFPVDKRFFVFVVLCVCWRRRRHLTGNDVVTWVISWKRTTLVKMFIAKQFLFFLMVKGRDSRPGCREKVPEVPPNFEFIFFLFVFDCLGCLK